MTIGRCGAEIVKVWYNGPLKQPPGTTPNNTVSRASWNYESGSAHPKRCNRCSSSFEAFLSYLSFLSLENPPSIFSLISALLQQDVIEIARIPTQSLINQLITSQILLWSIAGRLCWIGILGHDLLHFLSEPSPSDFDLLEVLFCSGKIANAHISVNMQDKATKPMLFWKLWLRSKWWCHYLGHRSNRGEFDFWW